MFIVRWWYPWYTDSPSERIVRQAERDLAAARQLWQSHGQFDYRFTFVEQNIYYNTCRTTAAQRNNAITIEESTCDSVPDSLKNIPDLFRQIEQTLSARECGPNGCRCDGHIYMKVSYHPEYGYPAAAVTATTHVSALSLSQSNPLTVFRQPFALGCTLIGFGGTSYEITQFEVIP